MPNTPLPHIERLSAPPATFAQTREGLHKLAELVISPARAVVDQQIDLHWNPSGFGTGVFGDQREVRVEADEIAAYDGGSEVARAKATSTLAAATALELPADGLDDAPLNIDPAAARWLSDFYAFSFTLLNEYKASHDPSADPVRLWPEHFDVGLTLGEVNFGMSPGDENHRLPYAYIGPWTPPANPDPVVWNAVGFTGAEIGITELVAAADQRAAIVELFDSRMAALTG